MLINKYTGAYYAHNPGRRNRKGCPGREVVPTSARVGNHRPPGGRRDAGHPPSRPLATFLCQARAAQWAVVDALSLKGLAKVYPTGVEALKGIDLTVREGEFYALLGPNGAGKTTAIGIITTLVNKTAGKVHVFGHDLDTAPAAVKKCIGVTPQEANLNMFEKLMPTMMHQAGYFGLAPRQARRNAEKCLKAVRLWDERNMLARTLSGGMKRRLMIARAMVHDPQLLILDEPTAGVDIEIRRSMWDLLREINERGVTIILTTHYLEEAEHLCRRIAILDRGEIVVEDRMERVLRQLPEQHFVISLQQPASPGQKFAGFQVHWRSRYELEVEVPAARSLNEFFELLNAAGIQVLSIRHKTNRLEELFVRLTMPDLPKLPDREPEADLEQPDAAKA